MALDPQARAVLDQMIAIGAPPINELSVSEARRQATAMTSMQGAPESVAKVEDRILPSLGGGIPVRIYKPPTPLDLLNPEESGRLRLCVGVAAVFAPTKIAGF